MASTDENPGLLALIASAYFAALANEKCETAVSLFAQRRLAAQASSGRCGRRRGLGRLQHSVIYCAIESRSEPGRSAFPSLTIP